MKERVGPSSSQARKEAFLAGLLAQFQEESFQRITSIVSQTFHIPICAISFIQGPQQCFYAKTGLPEQLREMDLQFSLCQYVWASGRPEVFMDPLAQSEPEFSGMLREGGIQFYAGVPLYLHGEMIGTLCVMDTVRRTFSEQEVTLLQSFSQWVTSELELRWSTAQQLELERALHEDLAIARRVQQMVLVEPMESEHIRVHAVYLPSKQLSGDMYFWCQIDAHRYGILLVDVMGHGVSAALISMSIRSLLRGMVSRVIEPAAVMAELNRQLYQLYAGNDEQITSYATGLYVLVDTERQEVQYVNAGHPPGYLLEADGTLSALEDGCMPLGILPSMPIQKGVRSYAGNTKILLYTDGLLEAFAAEDAAKLKLERADVIRLLEQDAAGQTELLEGQGHDDICLITASLAGSGTCERGLGQDVCTCKQSVDAADY